MYIFSVNKHYKNMKFMCINELFKVIKEEILLMIDDEKVLTEHNIRLTASEMGFLWTNMKMIRWQDVF